MTSSSLHGGTYLHLGAGSNPSHDYLLPPVLKELRARGIHRVFDLGCGSGYVDSVLTKEGIETLGVDPSENGIALANATYPNIRIFPGSAYDDLAGKWGKFPAVMSLEVVEHLYDPTHWASTAFDLIEPNGIFIVSTPYHGWLKNVVIAATGKFDAHFQPLRTHGHIKFWSNNTLRELLTRAGFGSIRFERVGRIPPLACSLMAFAERP
ncbi:MAG TPA: class I SAM-dependent methyltransferase [Terracidiphilus sp.]|nr:class I SAM-dependent methyltransferase [Terracidiphilus sp.]